MPNEEVKAGSILKHRWRNRYFPLIEDNYAPFGTNYI